MSIFQEFFLIVFLLVQLIPKFVLAILPRSKRMIIDCQKKAFRKLVKYCHSWDLIDSIRINMKTLTDFKTMTKIINPHI